MVLSMVLGAYRNSRLRGTRRSSFVLRFSRLLVRARAARHESRDSDGLEADEGTASHSDNEVALPPGQSGQSVICGAQAARPGFASSSSSASSATRTAPDTVSNTASTGGACCVSDVRFTR